MNLLYYSILKNNMINFISRIIIAKGSKISLQFIRESLVIVFKI
ncbi:protein of unknown function [Clostridium beijerinckii]|nr:protein of unknown function [Clostridium beijerinckii]